MGEVAIVDTSILCNILDIPKKNQDRQEVMEELEKLLENGTNLLLPMATVYETGNHIAQIGNGNQQRQFAEIFVDVVKKAISGDAPWTVMQVPTLEEVSEWLNEFPDSAMRGAGIADLSMIKEWEKMKRQIPNRRVFIWSLDDHLNGYDYHP